MTDIEKFIMIDYGTTDVHRGETMVRKKCSNHGSPVPVLFAVCRGTVEKGETLCKECLDSLSKSKGNSKNTSVELLQRISKLSTENEILVSQLSELKQSNDILLKSQLDKENGPSPSDVDKQKELESFIEALKKEVENLKIENKRLEGLYQSMTEENKTLQRDKTHYELQNKQLLLDIKKLDYEKKRSITPPLDIVKEK